MNSLVWDFLRQHRGITGQDWKHIGYRDREALLQIAWCPVCGLDKCSSMCHLDRRHKLFFDVQRLYDILEARR